MRTLILGCKGQLGKDLMTVFGEVGEVLGFDLPETDVSSEGDVRHAIEASRCEFIVNSAAYTDVEGAEDEEASAFLANEQGARIVAEQAAAKDLPWCTSARILCSMAQKPHLTNPRMGRIR